MASVSIHYSLSKNLLVQSYAKDLSLYLNGVSLSGVLGKVGGFERNSHAESSGIMKIHVKIPEEGSWPSTLRQPNRSSDNFLIYVRHWDYADYFQIIALITPEAHSMADRVLPSLIEIADKYFHSLRLTDLLRLPSY